MIQPSFCMRQCRRYWAQLIVPPLLSLLVCTPASATDLIDIFDLAVSSDPTYLEARADFQATVETRTQTRAQLLPQVTLSADTFRNNQDISTSTDDTLTVRENVVFNSHGFSFDLRQPIFRAPAYLEYQQSDNIIEQAQAELRAARVDLAIRVVEAYFDLLAARDNLTFAQAEKRSLEQQLEQANQRFEVGLTAKTDIQEARAGFDRAVAEVIEAENAIDNARESLREITGEYVNNVESLEGKLPLVKPNPEDIDTWTSQALEQNMSVIAARHALETADQQIDIQRAEHLPTLDLVATKDFQSSGGFFGGRQIQTESIGLEFNMPLFQGGAVTSQTREAEENRSASLQRLRREQRTAQSRTRQSYLGVISGISRIKALEQAVVSSKTALEATNAGFDAGTRTSVDVVAAERALSDAKRNLARARYDYIVNSLRLKRAAGVLTREDLARMNRWLQ